MAIMPIVNLNGTPVQDLIKQQHDVVKAARVMEEAMARAMPHGRDYAVGVLGTDSAPTYIEAAREDWDQHRANVIAARVHAERVMEDLMKQNIDRNGDKAYELVRHIVLGEMK